MSAGTVHKEAWSCSCAVNKSVVRSYDGALLVVLFWGYFCGFFCG